MNVLSTICRATALLGATLALAAAACAATTDDDLAAMSDQLDAADRADFMDALDKASGCTQARDFACTEVQLKKAAKLAHGPADKRELAAARRALSAEQTQVAEEARQRAELAEQERRLAEAEERLRVAEARAREDEADAQPSTASQLLQFGALVAQNYAANRATAAAAAQAAKLPLADLSADRQRIADQRARLVAAREQAESARQAQAAQARAAQTAARQASERAAPSAGSARAKAVAAATPPIARMTGSGRPPAYDSSSSSAASTRVAGGVDPAGLTLTRMPTTSASTMPDQGVVGGSGVVGVDRITDPDKLAREERWQRLLAQPKTLSGRFEPLTPADEFHTEAQARAAAQRAVAAGALESMAEGVRQIHDAHLTYQKLVSIGPINCRRWVALDAWQCGVDVTVEVVADAKAPPASTSK